MTTTRFRLAFAASTIALSLAMPLLANGEPQSLMAGTVVDFHGKYGLVVRDVHGALAEVRLHQGTIIKPVGLRLERGMKVIIIGQASAEAFAAGRIDAPLEVWPPPARTALARASSAGDGYPIAPGRNTRDDRWTEFPGQYSVPSPPEPRNPH